MPSALYKKLTAFALCICLMLIPRPAKADQLENAAIGVVVAIVAVGVAIGVGVYFLVRRPPSITGCTATASDNLTLLDESDHQTYTLSGDIAAIKAGQRVHVSGKKQKSTNAHAFLVNKVVKDYGPCKATP
jgi:hypothetical protein